MLAQAGSALAVAAMLAAVPVVAHNDGGGGGCGKVAKEFTPIDMLTSPRPKPAIAAPGSKHAVSLVNVWDDKTDT